MHTHTHTHMHTHTHTHIHPHTHTHTHTHTYTYTHTHTTHPTHIHTQYGFITYPGEGRLSESVFFHMNSLIGGCDFSELRAGDEVEFLLTFSQKARKNSAIHVKKLRWVRNSCLLRRHGRIVPLGLGGLCLKFPVLCYASNSWKCHYYAS